MKKKAPKRARVQEEAVVQPSSKKRKSDSQGGTGAQFMDKVPPPENPVPAVLEQGQPDMSAWDEYGLDVMVIKCLAKLGFTSPTDIQHECLPAAILGNSDIVAAAQTVRYLPHEALAVVFFHCKCAML
jgi:hypothetical protein